MAFLLKVACIADSPGQIRVIGSLQMPCDENPHHNCKHAFAAFLHSDILHPIFYRFRLMLVYWPDKKSMFARWPQQPIFRESVECYPMLCHTCARFSEPRL